MFDRSALKDQRRLPDLRWCLWLCTNACPATTSSTRTPCRNNSPSFERGETIVASSVRPSSFQCTLHTTRDGRSTQSTSERRWAFTATASNVSADIRKRWSALFGWWSTQACIFSIGLRTKPLNTCRTTPACLARISLKKLIGECTQYKFFKYLFHYGNLEPCLPNYNFLSHSDINE